MNPKIRNKERQGILKTLILQPLASRYFFLISLPLLFRSLSIVLGSCLRGTHDTRTPMRINLAANALNVILNYLLIYVLALGVTGAAIATALSTVVSGSGDRSYIVSRLCGLRSHDYGTRQGCLCGAFHCGDGGGNLLYSGVRAAQRNADADREQRRGAEPCQVPECEQGQYSPDPADDVSERTPALSERVSADETFYECGRSCADRCVGA